MLSTPHTAPAVDQLHQPDGDNFRAVRVEDVQWRSFPAFPPEARLAILVGDPSREGPYVVRVKLPAGVKLMPHKHPEDRVYTVLSGVFYIGLGEVFDESRLTAYAPGDLVVLPGGQPHFHWAKSGGYITQVSAIGPLGLAYVDPAHDPRSFGARARRLINGRQNQRTTKEISMIRKARAAWRGTGRDGDGDLSTDSGVLQKTPYSYKTRFENEKGTNPEELIAAAHAGCFTMALAFQLQTAGYTPTELVTEAAVSLEPEGQGFSITRSALVLRASIPGIDETTFKRLAAAAEQNCPVSKLFRAEITLDAELT